MFRRAPKAGATPVVALALALATPALLTSARPAAGQLAPADSTARWVDSVFAPYASPRAPGCAVAVVVAGHVRLAKGYGSADLSTGRRITPETPFYIASLAKQFTAMSVVLLAQQGRLSIDDPLGRWIPELPAFADSITLRELLQHTSGLRDYLTLLAVSGWPADGPLTEARFLDLVRRQRSLNFAPGDEFLYSNTGYALLAVVVRRASGQSLRDFAAGHIFAPLGMTHTEFRDDHRMAIPDVAHGYENVGTAYRLAEPALDVVGDGGAFSTAADLVKWNDNFLTGRVGGAAGVALLEQPGHLNDGEAIPYGLGLTIGSSHGRRLYAHSGVYGGYHSAMLRFPDDSLGVIALCNTSAADAGSLAQQVADVELGVASQAVSVETLALLGDPWPAAGAPARLDSTDARRRTDAMAQLAGEYYSDELDLPVTLVPQNGVLLLRRPHADELRFVPSTGDLYMSHDQMLLRVLRDETGAVTGFTLTISRVRDLKFTRRAP